MRTCSPQRGPRLPGKGPVSWSPSRICVGSCLDFPILSLDRPRFATGCCPGCSIARSCSRLTVGLLADALHRALQVIGGTANAREIASCKRIAHGLDLVLNLAAQAHRDSA